MSTNRIFLLLIIFGALFSCSKEDNDSSKNVGNKSSLKNVGTVFNKLSSKETGITFENTIIETESFNHLLWQSCYMGGGVGLGDINNDGLLDIYFTGNLVNDKLYLNKGGMEFEDISVSSGISKDVLWSNGVTFADVNGDGYQDIYVCNTSWERKPELRQNKLYINQKNNTFIESAAQFGIQDNGYSMQSTFFDYDKDGDLDMFLCNEPIDARRSNDKEQDEKIPTAYFSNKLYRNINNEKFVDVSKSAGLWSFSYSLSGTASDLNKNGLTDLYVCNDFDIQDYLYTNNGNLTFNYDTETQLKHSSNFSMGADIADFNNDGLNDIVTVDMAGSSHYRSKTNMGSMSNEVFWSNVNKGKYFQYMFNSLQLNNGNDSYSDIAQLGGIAGTDWSWSVIMADFDNDGYKDISVSNGIQKDVRNNDFLLGVQNDIVEKGKRLVVKDILSKLPSTPISNYLYQNNGDLSFGDKTKEWGFFDPGFSNGMAYGDLDNDGDLDIIINNVSALASVYENTVNKKRNYLKLDLKGSERNITANGTKVTIYYGDNEKQYVEVNGTRGYFSYSDPRPHFGLGNVKTIDKVEIIWPNDKVTTLTDVAANQILKVNINEAKGKHDYTKTDNTLFAEISSKLGVDYKHQENDYDDFLREILIPYKESQNGPYISLGDVNGDGIEDMYLGNAHTFTSELYLGTNDGFKKSSQTAFVKDKAYEDMGSAFFDADGDGDLDLYVTSGGNEFDVDNKLYQDRLYINNGKGQFSKSKGLPTMLTSTQSIVTNDVDGDGDLDIFVGGRQIAGHYPQSPRSYLLLNDKGTFTDVTLENAPDLEKPGMVTQALFSDFDSDGDKDLVLVGEWMPISFYENTNGKFINKTESSDISNYTGIWWSIQEGDFDGDGDMDYIAGNLSKNNKFHASMTKPFVVYNADFDKNGTNDVVLAKYSGDNLVPVRGRECSSQQLPYIEEKFPTFDQFARASIDEVLDGGEDMIRYEATTLASAYIENKGRGQFGFNKLPNEFQTAPLRSVVTLDINGDGHLDWMGVGNNYQAEVETTRYDAGIGYTALGDGKGGFTSLPPYKSGFYDQEDTRDVKLSKDKKTIYVAENQGPLKAFRLK